MLQQDTISTLTVWLWLKLVVWQDTISTLTVWLWLKLVVCLSPGDSGQ